MTSSSPSASASTLPRRPTTTATAASSSTSPASWPGPEGSAAGGGGRLLHQRVELLHGDLPRGAGHDLAAGVGDDEVGEAGEAERSGGRGLLVVGHGADGP